MRALIQKDAYVLWKQMRIFILVLAAMSVTGGVFGCVFIVVWCSMLPYSAIAYDERSKWDQFAAMMPYSRRDLVLSKYLLGWLCMAGAVALSMAVQSVVKLAGGPGPDISLLLTSLMGGVVALDVTLPMIFRFGVEKGRLVFMLVVFAVTLSGSAAAGIAEDIGHFPMLVTVGTPVVAAVATAVSVPLSMKFYKAG